MRNSPDPSLHRERERQMIEHVERLLDDDRLRVDTVRGRVPAVMLLRDVSKSDHAIDLKRLMAEMNLPDRELQNRMPTGQTIAPMPCSRSSGLATWSEPSTKYWIAS